MRNFFVSDKQIVPAQGAPVLGMLVASWPWPCQKYDQTKSGDLIHGNLQFYLFGSAFVYLFFDHLRFDKCQTLGKF